MQMSSGSAANYICDSHERLPPLLQMFFTNVAEGDRKRHLRFHQKFCVLVEKVLFKTIANVFATVAIEVYDDPQRQFAIVGNIVCESI